MPQNRSLSSALDKLSGLDMFGHPIGVHFRGNGSYQTKLGAFCTLVTVVLATVNTFIIGGAFLHRTDQTEFYQSIRTRTSDMEPISISES